MSFRMAIKTALLLITICCLALGWYTDHRNQHRQLFELRQELAQLKVAHKDATIRRQHVRSLIGDKQTESIPALINALLDDQLEICLEARAGLESLTKHSFRRPLPEAATRDDFFAAMQKEHLQWQRWVQDNPDQ